ncbi:MAG: ABC transporter substrate-binding protein [Spirochaetota bacterium]
MNSIKHSPFNRAEKEQEREHLNFLIYAPGIFKRTFKEGFDNVARIYRNETGHDLKIYGPMEWPNHGNDKYEDIWKTSNIDCFPDVVAAMGFGDFVRKEFVEKFVKKGCFKSGWDRPVSSVFEKAGFIDPRGWYTAYSVVPFVMLVDRKRLGDLQMPRQWKDLLTPQFRNKVIISQSGNGAANVPLLYIYKEMGEEGITRLARNIKAIWPAARIAREAGSDSTEGAAVYILSWFFANSCVKTKSVSVVWPEDGAFTSPLYILVKESKAKEMKAIVQYITSFELGAKSAQFCLPVLHPGVDNSLPEGATFKWLGWDYIQSHDTAELREYSHALFMFKWKDTKHYGEEYKNIGCDFGKISRIRRNPNE